MKPQVEIGDLVQYMSRILLVIGFIGEFAPSTLRVRCLEVGGTGGETNLRLVGPNMITIVSKRKFE